MPFVTPSPLQLHLSNHIATDASLTRRLPPRRPVLPRATRASRMTATEPTAVSPPVTIDKAWPPFAERMRTTGEIPPLCDWHNLLDGMLAARDDVSKAIWLVSLMRDTGLQLSALTYEKLLTLCSMHDDRQSAFYLVELMFNDKILIGDVDLPDGMEPMLRKILPPEAFE